MSAGCLSNVCPSSSPNPYKMSIHDVASSNPIQKQGFLSILNNNNNNNNPPNFPSIRRTSSAEMLAVDQPMIKRTQSSDQLDFLAKDNDHDHDHQEINGEKKGAFEDIWSSIQKNGGSGSGKSGSGDLPAPYVHPMVKRSTSLLSQKSLEICTESLGSETGSEPGLDVLSPYPASDPGVGVEKDGLEEVKMMGINHDDHGHVEVKCTGTTVLPSIRRTLSSPPTVVPTMTSFPPPLPSLSHREGPTNLHMRSLRRDGRLVVEAVPVPSVNRLQAQRRDGRLLLLLSDNNNKAEDINGGEDSEEIPAKINGQNVIDHDHDDDHDEDDQDESEGEEEEEEMEEENEDDEEMEIVMETKSGTFKTTSSSSLLMSKIMELTKNRPSSAWPRNFNATIVNTVLDQDENSSSATLAAKSQLPPRPVPVPVRLVSADSTATVLNAYEYYWRRRGNCHAGGGTTVAVLKPLAGQKRNNSTTTTVHVGPQVGKDSAHLNKLLLAHQEKLFHQGEVEEEGVELEKGGLIKGEENLVPWLRGCKEPRVRGRRSSLLFWDSSEPTSYCIATS